MVFYVFMTLRKVFYNKAASKYFSMVLTSKNFTLMHLHNHDPNPVSRNDYLHFAHEAMEPWGVLEGTELVPGRTSSPANLF